MDHLDGLRARLGIDLTAPDAARLAVPAPAPRVGASASEQGASWPAVLSSAALLAHERWVRQSAKAGRRLVTLDARARGAVLEGAWLPYLGCLDADWSGARLGGTELAFLELVRTPFHGAELQDASLVHARLLEGVFDQASMARAVLDDAWLSRGSLREADLRGSSWQRAIVSGVDLRGARLTGSRLEGACLVACDLRGAELSGVELRGVELERCDLRDARLAPDALDGAALVRDCTGVARQDLPSTRGARLVPKMLAHLGATEPPVGWSWTPADDGVLGLRVARCAIVALLPQLSKAVARDDAEAVRHAAFRLEREEPGALEAAQELMLASERRLREATRRAGATTDQWLAAELVTWTAVLLGSAWNLRAALAHVRRLAGAVGAFEPAQAASLVAAVVRAALEPPPVPAPSPGQSPLHPHERDLALAYAPIGEQGEVVEHSFREDLRAWSVVSSGPAELEVQHHSGVRMLALLARGRVVGHRFESEAREPRPIRAEPPATGAASLRTAPGGAASPLPEPELDRPQPPYRFHDGPVLLPRTMVTEQSPRLLVVSDLGRDEQTPLAARTARFLDEVGPLPVAAEPARARAQRGLTHLRLSGSRGMVQVLSARADELAATFADAPRADATPLGRLLNQAELAGARFDLVVMDYELTDGAADLALARGAASCAAALWTSVALGVGDELASRLLALGRKERAMGEGEEPRASSATPLAELRAAPEAGHLALVPGRLRSATDGSELSAVMALAGLVVQSAEGTGCLQNIIGRHAGGAIDSAASARWRVSRPAPRGGWIEWARAGLVPLCCADDDTPYVPAAPMFVALEPGSEQAAKLDGPGVLAQLPWMMFVGQLFGALAKSYRDHGAGPGSVASRELALQQAVGSYQSTHGAVVSPRVFNRRPLSDHTSLKLVADRYLAAQFALQIAPGEPRGPALVFRAGRCLAGEPREVDAALRARLAAAADSAEPGELIAGHEGRALADRLVRQLLPAWLRRRGAAAGSARLETLSAVGTPEGASEARETLTEMRAGARRNHDEALAAALTAGLESVRWAHDPLAVLAVAVEFVAGVGAAERELGRLLARQLAGLPAPPPRGRQ